MSKYTQSFQFLLATSSIFMSGIVLTALPAQALRFNFGNITGNSAVNAASGESQLLLDVTDAAGNDTLTSSSVLFKFSNVGSAASSITQIYFDNSNVLKTVGLIGVSGSGVSYSQDLGSLNLPGGSSLTNKFVSDFGIGADSKSGGVAKNGVNPGEWVNVLFNLTPAKTLADVLNDMKAGTLRVGMHVQAFGDGGSEAFVNKIPTPPVAVSPPPVVVSPPPVVVSPPPVVVPTPPVVPSVLVPSVEIKPPAPKRVPEPALLWAMGAIAGRFALRRRAKTVTGSSEE